MRVLLVGDTVGGVRTFIRELARGLTGRGVELHLALLGDGEPGGVDGVASCQSRQLRLEWMAEPWGDVAASAEWIRELCDELQPDTLHMNTFTPVLDPAAPVLLTVHSDVLSWWHAVHGQPAPPDWERYRRLVRRALDRAELVAVPTRAMLSGLRELHGPLPPTAVIPNGLALAGASAAPARPERLVVSVGRLWDAAKNVGLLLDAAPAVRGQVALIGDPGPGGDEPARTQRAAASAEPVRWLGPLPHSDVIRWLSRAAVFAEPARYEPFGLAALEAALCGCALVLGDIPTLREVWGEAAIYVAPDDAGALADAVNALLEDPLRRARAARAARAAALRRSPAQMADAYLRAYARLTQAAAA